MKKDILNGLIATGYDATKPPSREFVKWFFLLLFVLFLVAIVSSQIGK